MSLEQKDYGANMTFKNADSLTLGIVVRANDPKAHKTAADFIETCTDAGFKAIVSSDSLKDLPADKNVCHHAKDTEHDDLANIAKTARAVIVLGGDGTFLNAATRLYGLECPIMGINLGHLGFLTTGSLKTLVKKLQDDDYKVNERAYYQAKLLRDGKEVWQGPFLNDTVIQRNADEKMLNLAVDHSTWRVLEMRADGLIVSTPTGSTAYNLSAGGPVMHPQIDALVISPICPHNMSFRPVVVPPSEIRITNESPIAHLSVDGRRTIPMDVNDVVLIEKTDHKLHMLVAEDYNFFDVLREKFGWDSLRN